MNPATIKYTALLENIGTTLQKARENAVKAINIELVAAYWNIGKYIVEFEQGGKQRAEYGLVLLRILSKDLKLRYGKGFGLSNLQYMRLFYLKYPQFPIYQTVSGKSRKYQTLSGKLSWSHYTELLSVSDDLARQFYERAKHQRKLEFP